MTTRQPIKAKQNHDHGEPHSGTEAGAWGPDNVPAVEPQRGGVGRATDATSHVPSGLSVPGRVSREAPWVTVCGRWHHHWKFLFIFPLRHFVSLPVGQPLL